MSADRTSVPAGEGAMSKVIFDKGIRKQVTVKKKTDGHQAAAGKINYSNQRTSAKQEYEQPASPDVTFLLNVDKIKILCKIIVMNKNETIDIIKQRRSIRDYAKKQVSEDDLRIIIDAGIYAPNGGGNIEQDIYFTIIQNENILNRINISAKNFARRSGMEWLKELGNNNDFNCLYNAPTLIIVSYKKDSVCAVYDCSAVTQNMLLAAEVIGLGSCWLYFPLQAFEPDCDEELLKELRIPNEYKPITSIIVGYKENIEINIPERKTENIVFIK
jgi:nitroreductase